MKLPISKDVVLRAAKTLARICVGANKTIKCALAILQIPSPQHQLPKEAFLLEQN